MPQDFKNNHKIPKVGNKRCRAMGRSMLNRLRERERNQWKTCITKKPLNLRRNYKNKADLKFCVYSRISPVP